MRLTRSSIVAFVVIVTGAGLAFWATADQEKKGPLEVAAEDATLAANRVFRAPVQDKDLLTLMKDGDVALDQPELTALIQQLGQLKQKIEQASFTVRVGKTKPIKSNKKPKNQDLDEDSKDIAKAIPLYFQIQQRLYGNAMRIGHKPKKFTYVKNPNARQGETTSVNDLGHFEIAGPTITSTLYDFLNLKVTTDTALAVMGDRQSGLEYNFRHDTENKNADTMILGMTAQDKVMLEQDALHQELDYNNYGKLILFNNTLSRIENEWATQRMILGDFAPPPLQSCGKEFYSFEDGVSSHRDLFSNFLKGDRTELLRDHLMPGLANILSKAVLIPDERVTELLHAQLEQYPGTKKNFEEDDLAKKDDENYVKKDALKDAQLIYKDGWNRDQIAKAIISAQLPGDVWDLEQMAKRIATISFQAQRTLVAKFLQNAALSRKMNELISVSKFETYHKPQSEIELEKSYQCAIQTAQQPNLNDPCRVKSPLSSSQNAINNLPNDFETVDPLLAVQETTPPVTPSTNLTTPASTVATPAVTTSTTTSAPAAKTETSQPEQTDEPYVIHTKIDFEKEMKENLAEGQILDKNIVFSISGSNPTNAQEVTLNEGLTLYNPLSWLTLEDIKKYFAGLPANVSIKTKKAENDAKILANRMSARWEAEYKKSVETQVLAYLKGSEAHAVEQAVRIKNMQKFYADLEPTLLNAIHGKQVSAETAKTIVKTLKDYRGTRRDSLVPITIWPDIHLTLSVPFEEITKFSTEDSALNGIATITPATLHMLDRVYLSRPEEVSFLFYKKLENWASIQNQFAPFGISSEINNNARINRAMGDFLGELNSKFYETLKQRGIKVNKLTPDQSPLFQIMIPLAKEHLKKFNQKMDPEGSAAEERTEAAVAEANTIKGPYAKQPDQQTSFLQAFQFGAAPLITESPVTSRPDQVTPNQIIQPSALVAPISSLRTVRQPREPDPYPPVRDPVKRAHLNKLMLEAMSIIELGEDLSGPMPIEKLKKVFTLERAPSIVVGLIRHQLRETIPYRRYAMTLQDQYILSNYIYAQAETRYPALALQLDNKTDSPSILKILTDREKSIDDGLNSLNQQKANVDILFLNHLPESWKRAKNESIDKVATAFLKGSGTKRDHFYKAISAAAANQNGLAAEACSTTTDMTGDFRAGVYALDQLKGKKSVEAPFSRIFNASTFTRNSLINKYPSLKDIDARWKKIARSDAQKFQEDYLDPALNAAMVATGVVMAVMFSPMVIAGAGVWASTGSLALCLEAFSEEVVLQGGMMRILGSLMSSNTMFAMDFTFILQANYMSEVAHVVLPAQLAYQARVANSYLGDAEHSIVNHENLRVFAQEIKGQQLSADINKWMAYLMVIPSYASALNRLVSTQIKHALAKTAARGSEALVEKIAEKTTLQLVKEEGVNGIKTSAKNTADGLATRVNQKLGVESFSQALEREGTIKGTWLYIKTLAKELREGGINALNLATKMEDLMAVPQEAIAHYVSPQNMIKILKDDVKRQRGWAVQVQNSMKNAHLLSRTGSSKLKPTQQLVENFKNFAVNKGLKGSKTYRFVIAETEEESLQTGRFLLDETKPFEERAVITYGFYRNIGKRGKYLNDELKRLKTAYDELLRKAEAEAWLAPKRLEAEGELMRNFVKGIETPEHVAHYELTFKHALRDIRGTRFPITAIERNMKPELDMYWNVRAAFGDFHTFSHHLQLINPLAIKEFEITMAQRAANIASNYANQQYRGRLIGDADPAVMHGDFFPDDRWMVESLTRDQDRIRVTHGEAPIKDEEEVFNVDSHDFDPLRQ